MHEWFQAGILASIAALLFCVLFGMIYSYRLCCRALLSLEKWVDHVGRRGVQSAAWSPGSVESAAPQGRTKTKAAETGVADIPPEIIAPYLRKPPKSSGFGGPPGGDGDDQLGSGSDKPADPAKSKPPT